jgi:hypothetical protein
MRPSLAWGQMKRPPLQALGQQQHALAVEPQQLDQIAPAATEDEDVAAEGLGIQGRLGHRGQAIEALAHVGVAGHQPNPGVGGRADHTRLARSAASTARWLGGENALTKPMHVQQLAPLGADR